MPHPAVIVGATVIAVGVAIAGYELVLRPWWEEHIHDRHAAAAVQYDVEMRDKRDEDDEEDSDLDENGHDNDGEKDVWATGAESWKNTDGLRHRARSRGPGNAQPTSSRGVTMSQSTRSAPPRSAPIPVLEPITFEDLTSSHTAFPVDETARNTPDLLTGSTTLADSPSRTTTLFDMGSGRGLDSSAVLRDPFADGSDAESPELQPASASMATRTPTSAAQSDNSGSLLSAPTDVGRSGVLSPERSFSPFVAVSPRSSVASPPAGASSSSQTAVSSPFVSAYETFDDSRSQTVRSATASAAPSLPASGFATPISSQTFSIISADSSPAGSPRAAAPLTLMSPPDSVAGSEIEVLEVESESGRSDAWSELDDSDREHERDMRGQILQRRNSDDDDYVL